MQKSRHPIVCVLVVWESRVWINILFLPKRAHPRLLLPLNYSEAPPSSHIMLCSGRSTGVLRLLRTWASPPLKFILTSHQWLLGCHPLAVAVTQNVGLITELSSCPVSFYFWCDALFPISYYLSQYPEFCSLWPIIPALAKCLLLPSSSCTIYFPTLTPP